MRPAPPPRRPAGPDAGAARHAAWDALTDWDEGRSERLGDAIDAMPGLSSRDAALARELALGVARHERLYDHLCDAFLRPGAQPPPLRRALRLGAHQLFALDRIPPHAAVNATVDLLRERRLAGLAGVANAVMRRLAEMRLEERRADGPLGRLPAARLPADPGLRHGLPDQLVRDLAPLVAERFPGAAGEAAWAALNRVPHLCTRTRPGAPPVEGLAILRRAGEWTWWSDPAEALRGPVASGACVVQDHSQGRVVEAMRPQPGERVLDCCAAPGGKALASADRGALVVAADIAVDKAKALAAQFAGTLHVLAQDGRRPALAAAFDVVLLDAPCSNSGVLARRPEARRRYDARHLASMQRLQRELIAAAAGLVQPGGRLVYSTCSLAPAENQQVARGLPGWAVVEEELSWPDEWQAGGYVAVLRRTTPVPGAA